MGYFKVIIATGCSGVMTAISCVVLAASKYFGWQQVGWWVLGFIGIYAAIGCTCGVMNECVANARHAHRTARVVCDPRMHLQCTAHATD
jgi:uncharacterized membrane protein